MYNIYCTKCGDKLDNDNLFGGYLRPRCKDCSITNG